MWARKPLLAALASVAALWLMPAGAEAKVVWLCKPGQKANPCEPSLTTTLFSPAGKRLGVRHERRARHRKADCVYVYPTVSDQKHPQATQVVDDVLRSIALYQAARYCATAACSPRFTGSSRSRASSWRTYLRRFNKGRGVVLIGHSQGTFVLRRLISEEIDPKRSARRRLVSAILLGGNVTVKKGDDTGGDFERVRACRAPRQLGCVVAFSGFNETPPANAIFGRTTTPGLEVLCTNPAALGGGSAKLTSVYPTKPFADSVIGAAANLAVSGLPHPKTPWATFPNAYSGRCSRAGGANVLRLTPLGDTFELTPTPDAAWGLHLADANIALGDLADLVRRQIAVYTRR